MDIKPQNILVQTKASGRVHMYLTDFGTSRTSLDLSDTETDGPTGRTEMYCSPEVAIGDARGRSSDMFSLRCVFAETATIIVGRKLQESQEARSDDGISFHRNIPHVKSWLRQLEQDERRLHPNLIEAIIQMVDEKKEGRPSTRSLLDVFPT